MRTTIILTLFLISQFLFARPNFKDSNNIALTGKLLKVCSEELPLPIKAIDNLNEKLSKIPLSKIHSVYFPVVPSTTIPIGFYSNNSSKYKACVQVEKDDQSDLRGAVIYSKHYHENLDDALRILNEELETSNATSFNKVRIFESVGSIVGRNNITSYLATQCILYGEK